jgi:hypothetical protein
VFLGLCCISSYLLSEFFFLSSLSVPALHSQKVVSLPEQAPSLTSILTRPNNKDAINKLVSDLKQRGWSFIQLDETLLPPQPLIDMLLKFFTVATQDQKDASSAAGSLGYSRVDHKEGLRLLTGDRWHLSKAFVPPPLVPALSEYSYTLDESIMQLLLTISEPLFGKDPVQMARSADLPVAWGGHIGMLDTAYYFNNNPGAPTSPPPMGESIDDVNCVPHYDPGLLSLSVYSSHEGLQLQDPATKQWYDAPTERGWGVVWTGHAAVACSNGAVPAGIHRVVYPKDKEPRLTMWYEACTVTQCEPPGPSESTAANQKQHQSSQKPITISNAPTAKMTVPKYANRQDILKHIERRTGLPLSKVMRIDDSFHGPPTSFSSFSGFNSM